LHGTLVFDFEANSDNRLEVVVFHCALDVPIALGLNY